MTVLEPSRSLRTDIQVLRGFAVLVVLLYHAKIGVFSAGFLGVDIFFVVSGFLITRLVKNGIENGSFRFSDFYYRRAKRLLPAAYVTFGVTVLLAPFFLTSTELQDFRTQVIGAVTFTANVVLWRQSGYFEGTADLKPLLHVWSLAIEEQYYFFLPAALVFLPRRYWLRGAWVALISSYALCALMTSKPDAAFYLLPTRAWELLIGSVGALVALDDRHRRWLGVTFWPSLAAVLILPLVPVPWRHPGPIALGICLAVLVVILREHPMLSRGAGMRAMARIGDISYSLYLVHWPLFAFFNNVWVGEKDGTQATVTRVGLLVLSFVLAYALHRWVEEPFRHANASKRPALLRAGVASVVLVMGAVGVSVYQSQSSNFVHARRLNYGLDKACESTGDFQPKPACQTALEPKVLVWGDSYAMHVIPGLAQAGAALPLAQATRSSCGPLLGVAAVSNSAGYDEETAKRCIKFNESVFAYLSKQPSVQTVVLSSPFSQYIWGDQVRLMSASGDERYTMDEAGVQGALAALRVTAKRLQSIGKRVIVVAPPPGSNFDIGLCIERLASHLPTRGVAKDCSVSMASYRAERGRVLDFLSAVGREPGIEMISYDDYLCDAMSCRTYIDGTFIYRDAGHLSIEGSVHLAKAIGLQERVGKSIKP